MSDSETSSEDEDVPTGIWKSVFNHKVPLIVTLLGELAFCVCMNLYAVDAEEAGKDMPGAVRDHFHLAKLYWVVFAVCLVARVLTLLSWRKLKCGGKHSHYAAFLIFFSTIQWVYYLAAYYKLCEEMTGISWTPEVQIGPNTTEDAYVNGAMALCINTYGALGCMKRVNRPLICKEEYTTDECSGYSWTGVEPYVHKCCVKNIYALTRAKVEMPHTNIKLAGVFSVLQWLAVLAMKWNFESNPILRSNMGGDFMKGATVDILDAVIFGQYLLSDKLLYPKYGIAYYGSKGAPREANPWLFRLLLITWLVGFITAILSPVVYTFFRSADSSTPAPVRTYQGAVSDLLESLRLLHHDRSHGLVDEALKLQMEQYVSEAGGDDETHAVKVLPEDDDYSYYHATREDADFRVGDANRAKGANYKVSYKDTVHPREAHVVVSQLVPDVGQRQSACGPGCISGWCAGMKSPRDDFDGTAEIVDAVRSLFLLEMPFLMWRLFMESGTLSIDSFNVIVIAKNIVWGFHDLLVILSCNNPNATIFGYTPLRTLSAMINGSAMSSVWVGPAGLFRIAADFTTTSVKQRIQGALDSLNIHKAWLIVERERVRQEEGVEAGQLAPFEEAIEKVNAELAELEERAQMAHI